MMGRVSWRWGMYPGVSMLLARYLQSGSTVKATPPREDSAATHYPIHAAAPDISGAHDDGLLLAEVDFKWLKCGQDWRIDMQRFREDCVYADTMLLMAHRSSCLVLRGCAAALCAQR